jgi:hypothetical protein
VDGLKFADRTLQGLLLSLVVEDGRAGRQPPDKDLQPDTRHLAPTPMSLLAKQMKHGSQPLLSWLVIPAKGPSVEQGPVPPAEPRGKCLPSSPSKDIDPTTPKTAWEYYNEGTYVETPPQPSNTKTAGMEIVDREREREWLEQMDTILIFVCITSI